MAGSIIGPSLLSDIRDTIAVVRGNGGKEGVYGIPTRLEAARRGGQVRLGTIDATWFKGDDATVTQIKGDGTYISPMVTFTAKNWFSSVIVTTGTKKVACAKVDQTWILIAAECA